MSLDFIEYDKVTKRNQTTIVPDFVIDSTQDLMIKGHSFYAIWDEAAGLWKTSESDLTRLVDKETIGVVKYMTDTPVKTEEQISAALMRKSSSGVKAKFVTYCKTLMEDNYVPLNQRLVFSDEKTSRTDYASFKLPYSMTDGDTSAWDELMDVLYSNEREKIEWAIGCVCAGELKDHHKMLIMYGPPGSGKSTILNIISDMFKGYTCTFNSKSLGSSSDQYALEPFKDFPLIGIEHEADLSKIDSNARLNSLVSHEPLTVNEKYKGLYSATFCTMLMMGTNNPVKITDSKSGLIRRLIDVVPTGEKLSSKEYRKVLNNVRFEYGAIAKKCRDFYLSDPGRYDDYVPTNMMGETNNVFNFFSDVAYDIKDLPYITLTMLWNRYKTYCNDANILYFGSMTQFKTEAKEYFEEFHERTYIEQQRVRNVYTGFKVDKFYDNYDFDREVDDSGDSGDSGDANDDNAEKPSWLDFKEVSVGEKSKLDEVLADMPAQLAIVNGEYAGTPSMKWDNVQTKLKDIDSHKLHYVRVEPNHIVLDFDIKGEDGEKSLEKNLAAASKFPPTYAELSKSGSGIHLHYIYTGGDPDRLSRLYDNNVEIKVFTGKSSLRRKLTKCNDLDIASINSGLPFKEEKKKVINEEGLKNEKALRTLIRKNLHKEYHSNTTSSIDFIASELEKAYNAGMSYDVTDLRPSIMAFAAQSTNQSERCLKVVAKMKFKSEDIEDGVGTGIGESLAEAEYSVKGDAGTRLGDGLGTASGVDLDESDFIFFDVEVFPNLFVVVWKKRGPENECVTWINPSGSQIEELSRHKLIGFNNRGYDNHILYGRMLGYSEHDLYILSQRLVSNESKNATFRDAYNLSYTDIYDFASAGNKMSLKKWEIKLGIHHLELGLPWDKPVPKEMWDKVAEYCVNDVVSTEAVFDTLKGDYMARVILADIAGGTPNDTTNQLTGRLIFGKNTKPQGEFQYRDLSKPVASIDPEVARFLRKYCPNMMKNSFGTERSVLPYFDGYEFKFGKSYYKGVEVGEGGRVYAEPGIHYNVALIDLVSCHPHSTIAECLFGPRYTETFYELVYARVYIKHKEWDKMSGIMDGKLIPYVEKIQNGEIKPKDLSTALKTAINSVYGLTSARFPNKFKDERNVDNIVAKRGALFMVDLTEAVQAKGFTVAHIKTDSIKIPNATPEIIEFVMNFAEKYGYHFEHEATYERMCLINDAVYIAKYAEADKCKELYGYVPGDNMEKGGHWTATGARFAEPYIFKALFSHEEIEFKDLCVTKSVKTFMALDMNEGLADGEHDYRFIGRVGNFCPVIQGSGGGELYRVSEKKTMGKDGKEIVEPKYDAVAGTKGYRWLESEVVKNVGGAEIIDKSYFRAITDDAKAEIEKFGDFDIFVDDSVVPF